MNGPSNPPRELDEGISLVLGLAVLAVVFCLLSLVSWWVWNTGLSLVWSTGPQWLISPGYWPFTGVAFIAAAFAVFVRSIE